MRLDQALHDEQAQTGAAAAGSPPERAEHAGRELGRDTLALVAHGNGDRLPGLVRTRWLHHNRYRTSAVPQRVLHQVADDLVDLVLVQPGFRQRSIDLEPEPVWIFARRDPAGDDPAGLGGDVHHLPVHLEAP